MKVRVFAGIVFSISGLAACMAAPPEFMAASIRPSAGQVQFEHDGKTELDPRTLTMRDVTVATCLKFAYGIQDSQISGPAWLQEDHFDIVAKADLPVAESQMKLMMQALLADRFRLEIHRQSEVKQVYALTVAKGGHKMKVSDADSKPSRQNSATGTVAKAITVQEFGDFLSGPLRVPVVDMTGLKGRYDFAVDFAPYIPANERPDTTSILMAAIQGELGLKLESRKESIEVLMIDRVEKPSAN